MRRAPSVALVVDHPERDLAGLVLTALELADAGAICHLVPLEQQHRALWATAPDLAVLNYFRPGNAGLAAGLVEARIGLGVLDTEGGVWPSPDAYTELLWRDPDLRREIRVACIWGPRLASALVEGNWLAPEQVAVTGCPRFDFYHPDWRAVLAAEPEPRPRVLINTNFPVANARFSSEAANAAQLCRTYGWSPDRVERYLAAERAALAGLVEIATRLPMDFPGWKSPSAPIRSRIRWRTGMRSRGIPG